MLHGRTDSDGSILTGIGMGIIKILRAGPDQEIEVRGEVAFVNASAVITADAVFPVSVNANCLVGFLVNNGRARTPFRSVRYILQIRKFYLHQVILVGLLVPLSVPGSSISRDANILLAGHIDIGRVRHGLDAVPPASRRATNLALGLSSLLKRGGVGQQPADAPVPADARFPAAVGRRVNGVLVPGPGGQHVKREVDPRQRAGRAAVPRLDEDVLADEPPGAAADAPLANIGPQYP